MRHFRPNLRSEIIPLPMLLCGFTLIVIAMPCCLFELIEVRTNAWHRLPSVVSGIPIAAWQRASVGFEASKGATQINIDLFHRDGVTSLLMDRQHYVIDGQYDESIDGCNFVTPDFGGNLKTLGERLRNRSVNLQARWNLPNRPNGSSQLSALLRIDAEVSMNDVELVLETLESCRIAEIGYVGRLAKNP